MEYVVLLPDGMVLEATRAGDLEVEMKTLAELVNEIESNHHVFQWLVRSDDSRGYFANIYNVVADVVNPCWAKSPEEALEGSLKQLKEYLAGGKKRRYIYDE